jgi:hypothetical protein
MEFLLIAFIVVVIGIPLFFLFQSHVQPTSSLPQDDLERIYAELKKKIVVTSVYTQETKYRRLYSRLDDLLSKISERHLHFVLDVEAKYDLTTIANLFMDREHHSSEGMQYRLLHGKNDISTDSVNSDLLVFLCFFLYQGGRIRGVGEVSPDPKLMLRILDQLIEEKKYPAAMFMKGYALKYGLQLQEKPDLDEAEKLLTAAYQNGVGSAALELERFSIYRLLVSA